MKKIISSLIILMVVFSSLNAGDINEARAKAYLSARYLDANGYTIGALKGEYLSRGDTVTYSRYLYAGNSYAVIGAGDETVRDLDIMVYDSNWNEVASDNDTSNVTVVEFYAPRSGTYYFVTKMYSGHGYFFQLLGWR